MVVTPSAPARACARAQNSAYVRAAADLFNSNRQSAIGNRQSTMTKPLYLVTGGAGFIGSHLAEELVRRGHPVRVADNFSTGKRAQPGARARRRDPRGRPGRPGRGRPRRRWLRVRPAPGRHPLGAALGEGSRHLEPRQHRRDAQRARGRARRRRPPPRLRRLVVGLRRHADAAQARGHAARIRSRPTPCRSWWARSTGGCSRASTASRRSPSATSTCSGRGRTPARRTRA